MVNVRFMLAKDDYILYRDATLEALPPAGSRVYLRFEPDPTIYSCRVNYIELLLDRTETVATIQHVQEIMHPDVFFPFQYVINLKDEADD